MNRRRFLTLLGLGAASAAVGATVDPDQLRWALGERRSYVFFQGGRPDGHKALGLSLRFVKEFDIHYRQPTRIDVLYGMSVVQPQFATRLVSADMVDLQRSYNRVLSDALDQEARVINDLISRVYAERILPQDPAVIVPPDFDPGRGDDLQGFFNVRDAARELAATIDAEGLKRCYAAQEQAREDLNFAFDEQWSADVRRTRRPQLSRRELFGGFRKALA